MSRQPCHTTPFLRAGVLIEHAEGESETRQGARAEQCDYCGSTRLEWRKCKLICADCRQINKSCSDL